MPYLLSHIQIQNMQADKHVFHPIKIKAAQCANRTSGSVNTFSQVTVSPWAPALPHSKAFPKTVICTPALKPPSASTCIYSFFLHIHLPHTSFSIITNTNNDLTNTNINMRPDEIVGREPRGKPLKTQEKSNDKLLTPTSILCTVHRSLCKLCMYR
jgi:hypothetical protein